MNVVHAAEDRWLTGKCEVLALGLLRPFSRPALQARPCSPYNPQSGFVKPVQNQARAQALSDQHMLPTGLGPHKATLSTCIGSTTAMTYDLTS